MLTLTLPRTLTDNVWNQWKQQDTTPQLTWLSLNKLAEHLITECTERECDYQQIDFQSTLDSQLSYEENLTFLNKQIDALSPNPRDYGGPTAEEMRKAEMELKSISELEQENFDAQQEIQKLQAKLKETRQQQKQAPCQIPEQPTTQSSPSNMQIQHTPKCPCQKAIKFKEELDEITVDQWFLQNLSATVNIIFSDGTGAAQWRLEDLMKNYDETAKFP